MKEFKLESKSKLLKSYLFLIIVSSLSNLLFLAMGFVNNEIYIKSINFLSFLALAVFLVSIYAFYKFRKQGFNKLTFILPSISIILFLLSVILGFTLGFATLMQDINYGAFLEQPIVRGFDILLNLFELFFFGVLT